MKAEFYLSQIERMKNENPEFFSQHIMSVFQKELSWNDIALLKEKEQIELMISLRDGIKVERSSIDVMKLSQAIQLSRSGFGLCVMTTFNCGLCDKEEVWGSSAVPRICKSCATEMATNIAKNHSDIFK